MGFSSIADLESSIAGGKIATVPFFKRVYYSATQQWIQSFWQSGSGLVDSPPGGSYSGTAGVATAMTRTTPGAFLLNGDVSPDTRHLLSFAACTTSNLGTATPTILYLVDLLLYYPNLVLTGTPTTLDNTVTLPRYTDGVGVMAFVDTHVASDGLPLLTLTYTNSNDDTGQVSTTQMQPGQSSPQPGAVFSAGTVLGQGIAPFVPLAAGDTGGGIKKIESYSLSAGGNTFGKAAFVLCKPLAELHLQNRFIMHEKLLVPTMPKIEDGACLGLLAQFSVSPLGNDVFTGYLRYAWG